jgi:dienelactone hydrolase
MGDIGVIGDRLRTCVGDDEAWHREWDWLASLLEQRGHQRAALGMRLSAGECLLLSCLYHLMSERFLTPDDARRRDSYVHAMEAFETARQLSGKHLERVAVPYEGTALPAYFIPAEASGPAPAVIFLCGLDTTKELACMRVGQQLARRGIHCLAIDTPGVGEALRLQKLLTRYDYEVPVGAAVDYLQARPDVATGRIAVIGSSLGGYYATRAAAFEPRLKACVAWGGQLDYYAIWQRRLEHGGVLGVPFFQLMYITGQPTPDEALKHIEHFRLEEYAEHLTCPFLMLHGKDDQQIPLADAEKAFELVASANKELKVFSGQDGGSQHCQNDNVLPALHYFSDWLAAVL